MNYFLQVADSFSILYSFCSFLLTSFEDLFTPSALPASSSSHIDHSKEKQLPACTDCSVRTDSRCISVHPEFI